MRLFDFFKRKKISKQIKTIEIENLKNYIEDKKKESKSKENEIIKKIQDNLNIFINELIEKKRILKDVKLEEKKEDERIKFIIKENLFHYIESLDKLINNLKKIHEEILQKDLNTIIKEIDYFFIDFEKRSKLNFEKATVLIGKELGEVKDSINNFIKFLKNLIKENESFFTFTEIISIIEKKLESLKNNEESLKEIEIKQKENKAKIDKLEKEAFSIRLEIDKTKSSDSYKKEIEIENKIKSETENLKNQIYQLKNMIDFKKLANIFHYNHKKMIIINEYKTNFIETFFKDRFFSLIQILEETNSMNLLIKKEIDEIISRDKNIEKMKKEFNKKEFKKIDDLNKTLLIYESEKNFLDQDNEKNEKRKEKIIQQRNDILKEISYELNKINVELKIFNN